MFSGFQELLIVGLIMAAIIIMPRVIKPRPPSPKRAVRRPGLRLSPMLRLAMVLSVLWPVGWALYLTPWRHHQIAFCAIGLGPVAIGWCVRWILAGKKSRP